MSPLLRLPILRTIRSKQTYLTFAGAFLAAAAFAWSFRHRAHGADDALLGPATAYVLPFGVYSLTGIAIGQLSLARAVEPLVEFGASKAMATVATISWAMVISALMGALVPALLVVIAHGGSDPPLAADILVSARAGALAAAAMSALVSLGAAFGARGGGRALSLLFLLVFGSADTGIALFAPTAHLRGLLGGIPPLDMGARASEAALAGMILGWVLLATLRTVRANPPIVSAGRLK